MDLIQVSTLSAHFSPVPPFMEAWLTRVAGTSGENTGAFGGKTDTYGGHAETFGGNGRNTETSVGNVSAYGGNAVCYGGNAATYGGKTDTRGGKTKTRGGKTDTRGGSAVSRAAGLQPRLLHPEPGTASYGPTPRNPVQETAISVQFVPGMRFLAFGFGVYAPATPSPVLTSGMVVLGSDENAPATGGAGVNKGLLLRLRYGMCGTEIGSAMVLWNVRY
eukprot:2039199-Rhodomonas_salina.1